MGSILSDIAVVAPPKAPTHTKHTHWPDDNAPNQLTVVQVLIDPVDQNDWDAILTLDLPASRTDNRVALRFDGAPKILMGTDALWC